jgi:hypothetical protein
MILILLKMKIKARSARPGVSPPIRPVSWTKSHILSSFLDKSTLNAEEPIPPSEESALPSPPAPVK